ncbi:Protein FAR-RED ELONGATED HYPOCOTYL [Arachis hypogaea]|nr:Protein FAR-RED ELONGATED HYPOCOTYL [Arachis hypogaea]
MDHSTSDCQLNPGEVDYEFESNEVPEPVYLQFMALKPLSVVDDELVPKVGMTFTTLEDAGKFYRNYAKAAGFSTRVRCTNRKGNEIKNQLITCSREGKWKSKISPTEKTNPTAGLNCPARIYIHTLKDVGAWIISKVVLDHSHPCCPSKAKMLKQHRELSMSIRHTIENNEEADLYEDRHIWVPIYLDHHFWAGMRSTQRSESMHSFFNKYITRNSSLIQFVKQYDNCLGSREQAERESDAADFHTVIPCATKSSIEAQFQDAYTHAKFREVQAQFRGKANCITRLKNSALGYSVYEVGEQVSSSIFNKFVVTYDSVAAEVKCQCLLFESRGILCRHALSVLSFEQVSQVPPRYILERWSKKELTAILYRAYDNVMAEMESLKAKRKGTSSLSHEDANLESVNELQSPPRIRTRGRPKNRLGSKLDKQIANATKKKKTKVLSEINLFDAASAVHSNSSQYQGHVINYQFRVPAAGDNSLGV